MTERSATAELAKLRNVEAFWELLVRNNKFLPQFSSKFINGDTLSLIEQGKIFNLTQDQVVFRVCVKPPSKLVLVQKFNKYLEQHNIPSGIDMARQNFPDKYWLILSIATLSAGKDEIFGPDYLPRTNQFRESISQQ
jgi:hypothetical protein